MRHTQLDAPTIWTRRPKIFEPRLEIVLGSGPRLRGLFKMEAVRPDGRRRLLADWFPNLITDAGLNVIGTSGGWLNYCRVGTGSTAPAVTDTQLTSYLAETGTVQSLTSAAQVSTPPYYCYVQKTYRFAAGVAAGNLAEVGIASDIVANPSDVLFSHALILDSSSNPTTITVLSDEILDVTYQLRCYPPAADVTHTVNISGTDYDITERAAAINSNVAWCPTAGGGFLGGIQTGAVFDGAIGAVTSTPSGSSASPASNVNAAYGNNNLYTDATIVWGLSQGNFAGGIDSALMYLGQSGGGGEMQFGFSPAIPKTSSEVLSLVFRHSWGRGQS